MVFCGGGGLLLLMQPASSDAAASKLASTFIIASSSYDKSFDSSMADIFRTPAICDRGGLPVRMSPRVLQGSDNEEYAALRGVPHTVLGALQYWIYERVAGA